MSRQVLIFLITHGLLLVPLSARCLQAQGPVDSPREQESFPPADVDAEQDWSNAFSPVEPAPGSVAPTHLFPAQSPAESNGPGHTVALFNDSSTLTLGGNVSLVGIAATERTFVPWNPLFVLPPSGFGYNTNTFEMHARQTNFQAVFTGPETEGFTPGAFLKVYLSNTSLTSDTHGLLPVVAFADFKNDDWRFAIGLQPDLFAPRDPVVIPISLMGGGPATREPFAARCGSNIS